MKKLLLTPFLLASLFSFSGELKANPDSRYELPDPRSSLSESQSNSKDDWYLLNQNEIQEKGYYFPKWGSTSYEKLKITTVSNRTICERLASQEKKWIEQIDLGRDNGGTIFRYKAHTKCIKGRKENNANYVLRIASISMRNRDMDDNNYQFFNNDQEQFSSFDTLYFKDFSQCNFAKSKLDNWFTTLENKFLSRSTITVFVRYSTKCFRKT